jgi:hypothetical protein
VGGLACHDDGTCPVDRSDPAPIRCVTPRCRRQHPRRRVVCIAPSRIDDLRRTRGAHQIPQIVR